MGVIGLLSDRAIDVSLSHVLCGFIQTVKHIGEINIGWMISTRSLVMNVILKPQFTTCQKGGTE